MGDEDVHEQKADMADNTMDNRQNSDADIIIGIEVKHENK